MDPSPAKPASKTLPSADFTALGNGDNLYCSNAIEVAWTKAATDTADLRLNCGCGAHNAACPGPLSVQLPAGSSQGNHTFTQTHCNMTHATGVTVRTEIQPIGGAPVGNNRLNIKVDCPPIEGFKSESPDRARAVFVITLDSDAQPVNLARGADKYLCGRFNSIFGHEVIVAVQLLHGNGVEEARYVTAARRSWIDRLLRRKVRRWWVTLPHQVWGDNPGRLALRLFLIRKQDGLKSAISYSTIVTG